MDNTSLVYKNINRQLISIGCLLLSASACEFQPQDSSATGGAEATAGDTEAADAPIDDSGTSPDDTTTSCGAEAAPSSGLEAVATELRSGTYLWGGDGSIIEGSMVEHGTITITDATDTYEAGYVESISVDTFFASSICSGTDVLGVAGSATCGAISTPSASTICTGTTILGVSGAASCIASGSTGSGTAASAVNLCSNYYAYGSNGSAINGSRACSEINSANYTPSRTNLKVWLQADIAIPMNITSGSTVKSWPDISGNGYAFIDSGSITEPTYFSSGGSNNKPYFDFGGSSSDPDARYSDVEINDLNDISIFVVAKPDNPETSDMDFMVVHAGSGGGSTGNKTYSLAVIDRKLRMFWEYGSGTDADIETNANFTNATATTIWALMSAIRDDTNKLVDFRYNSSTQTVAYSHSATSGSSGVLRVGTDTNSTGQFDGGIAEILIYSEKLSGSNLTQVNCYLSEKYGLGITGC